MGPVSEASPLHLLLDGQTNYATTPDALVFEEHVVLIPVLSFLNPD